MFTFNFENFDYTDDFITLPKETILFRGASKDALTGASKDALTGVSKNALTGASKDALTGVSKNALTGASKDALTGVSKNALTGVNKEMEDILRDRPIFLGPKYIAEFYSDNKKENVKVLRTISSIRLLDLRKIMNIISMVLDYSKDKDKCALFMIVYGLCSYKDQIQMFGNYNKSMIDMGRVKPDVIQILRDKMNYLINFKWDNFNNNPVIPRGIRIGEASLDGQVTIILKEMFQDICDGYIAPRLFSPYHINNIAHEEIVIFNPKKELYVVSEEIKNINIKSINDRIKENCISIKIDNLNMWMKKNTLNNALTGGNKEYIDKNNYLDELSNKDFKKQTTEAKKFVNNLKVKISTSILNVKAHTSFYKE